MKKSIILDQIKKGNKIIIDGKMFVVLEKYLDEDFQWGKFEVIELSNDAELLYDYETKRLSLISKSNGELVQKFIHNSEIEICDQ